MRTLLESCSFISSNYDIIPNNSPINNYGTASIVKSCLSVENIHFDTMGRALAFDIGSVSFVNLYMHSGNDSLMRGGRETYLAEVIPNLLINSKSSGCIFGDFNCIIDKKDATKNQDKKISPSLTKLVRIFSWKDSFRTLFPSDLCFSRYYSFDGQNTEASRIDRGYHFGSLKPTESHHVGVAFSDHLSLIVAYEVPISMSSIKSPKSRPLFKANPDVICDPKFKEQLSSLIAKLSHVQTSLNLDILSFWEDLVKPNIKRLLITRGKEMSKEKKGALNLLLVQQSYLVRKLNSGQTDKLAELLKVHLAINAWYQKESEKILLQSKIEDTNLNEKVRIYQHELHQKRIKKSEILKLQVDDDKIIEGHTKCADFLEKSVEKLLLPPPILDEFAQSELLKEVKIVFSEGDNALNDTGV